MPFDVSRIEMQDRLAIARMAKPSFARMKKPADGPVLARCCALGSTLAIRNQNLDMGYHIGA